MTLTRLKFPVRSVLLKRATLGIILIASLLFAGIFTTLGPVLLARADSGGGNPTHTPTRTATPTETPTITPTFTQPPTLTRLPQGEPPLTVATVAPAQASPKALPTGTLLSLEEISATLGAPAPQPPRTLPSFWVYLFIIFAVAAAVVVVVVIGLMRQQQHQEEGDQNNPE